MSEVWKMIGTYAIVFSVGGALCAVAEILIVRTKLTPARILVMFLITGIVLEGIGVYDSMIKVCQDLRLYRRVCRRTDTHGVRHRHGDSDELYRHARVQSQNKVTKR